MIKNLPPMQENWVPSLGGECPLGWHAKLSETLLFVVQNVKNPPITQETWVQSLGLEDPLASMLDIGNITIFSSVQSLSRVRLFATLWTAALQTSLSITNSQSLLRLKSVESVMPSNHLILWFLAIGNRYSCVNGMFPCLSYKMKSLSGLTVCVERKQSEVAQSRPTLCDPMDCSPPGSSIHVCWNQC